MGELGVHKDVVVKRAQGSLAESHAWHTFLRHSFIPNECLVVGGLVVYTCDCSTWEVWVGGSGVKVPGQLVPCDKNTG